MSPYNAEILIAKIVFLVVATMILCMTKLQASTMLIN